MSSIRARDSVADLVVERARGDERIVALARTGSLARGTSDRWSDVDLFLGVDPTHAVAAVVEDLDAWLYADLDAVHHFDLHVKLPVGAATYRAALLGDGLEIDPGVAGAGAFATVGAEAFEVVFDRQDHDQRAGSSPPAGGAMAPAARASRTDHLVGLGWHHALHSRTATATATARRRPSTGSAPSLVTSLDAQELARAREAVVGMLLVEVEHLDVHLAARLRPVITGESD